MILSIKGSTPNDPMRLAAQVINGIGFIGAGVIWRGNLGIHGITTAADIWIASAIGLAIGLGFYDITIVTLICVFIILNIGKIAGVKSNDDMYDQKIELNSNDDDPK